MSFMHSVRKVFGSKGLGSAQTTTPSAAESSATAPSAASPLSNRHASSSSPFDQFLGTVAALAPNPSYPASGCEPALDRLSPEERGELLADMARYSSVHDGSNKNPSVEEGIASATLIALMNKEIAVRKEHLDALLSLLLAERKYYWSITDRLVELISSAIKQGAYLSSEDCAALAQKASILRSQENTYSKAEKKKIIARAERLEKLAGIQVSATELLMDRCEGAENPYAIADKPRPNAQFWADLLAEVTAGLEDIRVATIGSARPGWARDAAAFSAAWPGCGEIQPQFNAWKASRQPVSELVMHNGKRYGWASPDAYRRLAQTIPVAQAHSRYQWNTSQIPGLDVFADLENPNWTALVEHLITQRRATRPTKGWEKQALALCTPLGIDVVETRLHDWLALFHSPVLGRQGYTDLRNGERFVATIDRLDQAYPEWPSRYKDDIPALGRAIAITVASGGSPQLSADFHPQLVRCDDYVCKNRSATDGVLHLIKAEYKNAKGECIYESPPSWLRLSVENEEFLRGAVWLVALMPDRARVIEALERTALAAATYISMGEEGMRSKIIANAAIATLIAQDKDDINPAIMRLTKLVEHQSVKAPLLDALNWKRG